MCPPPAAPKARATSLSVSDIFFTAFSLFLLLSSPKPNLFFPKHPPTFSSPFYPRRFLPIPTMSLTHKNKKTRHSFPTPQSLSDWLIPRLPSASFASWGVQPGTKNLHNLWLEISQGETSLDDSAPPVRTLDVLVLRILAPNNRILLESHQELSDGSVRYRSRPLSEKMKPGEAVDDAAFRAVKEELGSVINTNIDGEIVRIVPNSYVKKVEERVSVSYPGLPARYVLHTVDAVVEGLPDGDFCTEEVEEYGDLELPTNEAVSCRKHYWKWVDLHSV